MFLPADYGSDGNADAAIWRPGPLGTAGFWIRDSTGGAVRFHPFGQDGDDPRVSGDYDGDGQADIAVYRVGAAPGLPSSWFYRRTFTGALVGKVWGQHGDTSVLVDFDGDQLHDFVVRRDARGGGSAVFLMSLTLGGIAGGFAAIFFGTPGDLVAPSDYDGDGRTDLKDRRNAGGSFQWWIRKPDGRDRFTDFGVSTDLPVPGDYDGDGKTDIAVWRPAVHRMFWVSKSSGGLLTRAWGTTGDYPVANWNMH